MSDININDFPDWENALAEYQTTTDPAARTAFEIRLRAGRFLAARDANPTVVSVLTPEGTAQPTEHMFMERMVADAVDGGRYLTFFTSRAELAKAPDYGHTEVSFQELYDEVLGDKTKAGAIINPAGGMLALTRVDLNRLMDTARDAGQEGFTARELSYSVQTACAWPPELQRVFAEALSRRPEARAAYMLASNVVWREDEPGIVFMIDFDGDSADLYAYLTDILEPLLRGVRFTFEQIQRKSRRSVRASVPPVYLRPDVSSKWESVNSGELPFPLFERWDAEIQAFRAHLNEAEDTETAASDFTAAFESKIYAAHYYVPLDTEKNPKVIDHLELGALLPVFTDWSELAKLFKPGARVTVWPFSAVYAAIARYKEFSGVVINPGGRNLVASRRQLDRIFCRATGRSGVYSRLAQMNDITAAEQVPRDLAANLAESLRRRPEVRAVYYLSVKTDDMPPVPLLAVDCACPEHLAFPAVESAMRKSTASSLLFSIAKADAGLLKRAGALTQPVYIRDG